MDTTARLLITCPDKPGIVSSVSTFLYNHGANITALDQHSTDPSDGSFFMRLEFQTPNLDLGRSALEKDFAQAVGTKYSMKWKISYAQDLKNVVLFVSKQDHALLELMWRHKRGELPCKITSVISNHPDLKKEVSSFGIPFHVVPVTKENKKEAEKKILGLLGKKTDLVVLARYMQILSESFVKNYTNKIINIHHSFLPAFAGADPYLQAEIRGVKLIGATAHYVTQELDQGPIIEQDVIRVSHRNSVQNLKEIGRDVERQVLARAVKWHLEDRVLVHGNKTIVFV